MANPDHLAMLRDIKAWNKWRTSHSSMGDFRGAKLAGADLQRADLQNANFDYADLSGANLTDANLAGAHFYKTDLRRARLREATLSEARLSAADLRGANLDWANLYRADLMGDATRLDGAEMRHAKLEGAYLRGASLCEADLSGCFLVRADLTQTNLRGAKLVGASFAEANLSHANLSYANLREAKLGQSLLISASFEHADLTGAHVFGVAAWNLNLQGSIQNDLVISPDGQPILTVDDLELAQFLNLLIENRNIRRAIDSITSKVVLILGRFTPERKRVLNAIKDALRSRNYVPVLFDFDKPALRDTTETVSTLAHMARFLIADLSDPKSIPQELTRIIPNLPSVRVQPILQASSTDWSMFGDLARYPWVRPVAYYESEEALLKQLDELIDGL